MSLTRRDEKGEAIGADPTLFRRQLSRPRVDLSFLPASTTLVGSLLVSGRELFLDYAFAESLPSPSDAVTQGAPGRPK